MVVAVNANDMLLIGLNCIGFFPERSENHCNTTKFTHYESAFGINPHTCCLVFNNIQVQDIGINQIAKPKVTYFLLALYWLKKYPVEQISSGIFRYHEDTIQKYVWMYCRAIQALKPYKILWSEHILPNNQPPEGQSHWMMSVDGRHCRIQEPRTVPDKDWYSHKHHKPCVAYELAIDLRQSRIAWISGPHKAGETDLVIFRKPGGLKDRIPEGFKIIGDKGYIGEEIVSVNNKLDSEDVRHFKRIARARHEDVNGRIKRFDILKHTFRHTSAKHKIAFEAVCILVQYYMENGHQLHPIPVENLV